MKRPGLVLAASCLLVAGVATADQPPPEPPSPPLDFKDGPAQIDLGHELALALPAGFRYLEPKAAGAVLEKMGNLHHDGLLGLVVPADDAKDYFVTLSYAPEGYVKDDEALDQDAIFETLKASQEEANKERVNRGFEALTLDGWAEPPRYDKAAHHLVWAIALHDAKGLKSVNFPTRVLGRHGYVRLNLVCAPENFAASKADMPQLLAATSFTKGARYEDFDRSTDKVAQYGLVALITGGVALKLVKVGLLAKFWNVILAAILALKKAIILLVVGAGALAKKLFGRKPAVAAATAVDAPEAAAPPEGEPRDGVG